MSDLLFVLIDLIWWPYDTWKGTAESSRLGMAPSEHETVRFWRRFAIAGTIILCTIGLAAWLFLRFFIGLLI